MENIARLLPVSLINVVALVAGYIARFTPFTETSVENKVRGFFLGPRFGAKNLEIGRYVVFSGERNIFFSDYVTIHAGAQIVAGRLGRIYIGRNSHVARNSVLGGGGEIVVGDDCKISGGVCIYSSTYERQSDNPSLALAKTVHKKVSIGNDVHIGANVTILPGIVVGDFATIGAGSVVTRNIDKGKTVVGVPARIV